MSLYIFECKIQNDLTPLHSAHKEELNATRGCKKSLTLFGVKVASAKEILTPFEKGI